MTREEVLALLEQRAQLAQSELASQTDAGEDVLHYLAQNGAVATRRAVAANPGAAPHTNRHLADDVDDDVRMELARKIARLMPDLGREEAQHLHAMTIATMERLARDQLPRVRAVLSESIKSLDCIPKYIVLTLAARCGIDGGGARAGIFAAAFGHRPDRDHRDGQGGGDHLRGGPAQAGEP